VKNYSFPSLIAIILATTPTEHGMFGKHWSKTYLIIYKVVAIKIIMIVYNNYLSR